MRLLRALLGWCLVAGSSSQTCLLLTTHFSPLNQKPQPSPSPSSQPAVAPSSLPSSLPSSGPSSDPSSLPSSDPSSGPSSFPSSGPSFTPSFHPSSMPSSCPSSHSSAESSKQPSSTPSLSAEYNLRRESYIDTCLEMTSKFNIILDAYRNQDINIGDLQNILDAVESNTENSSFNIPDLIRLLFFNTTAMQYESSIKNAILVYHFWLTHNDKNSVWWTENKSILFLSSHFLFNQLYNRSDEYSLYLRERLLHWLQLKVDYGFYELGSRVYAPYTLKGLLNLADYCEDIEIQEKAIYVAQSLLRHLLLSTNEQGVNYAVSSRDYWTVVLQPRGNNYNKLVYLLTGEGASSDITPSSIGVYMATTSLDVSPVYTYWKSHVDINFSSGHTLSELDFVNRNLTLENDRILFQWIGGAYFYNHSHALQTKTLLDRYHLWNHSDFVQYGISDYESLSLIEYSILVSQPSVEYQSRGTVLTGANVTYYKDKSSMLSSLEKWHSGYFGHQAIPWIASTGQLAVFGVVGNGQSVPSGGACASYGLPFVVQRHNLILVAYHPDATLKADTLAKGGNVDVLFYWPFLSFTETSYIGNWTISREGDSYVALRPIYLPVEKIHNVVTGSNYIWSDADPSVWAVVVGNSDVYGGFNHFISLLNTSKVQSNINNEENTITSLIGMGENSLSLDLML